MYRIELEFKENCTIIEKNKMLKNIDDLFYKEKITRMISSDNVYIYESDRTDEKLFGSYWSVLFNIKRKKYDVRKTLRKFEWIHRSGSKKEIKEDLLSAFFTEEDEI